MGMAQHGNPTQTAPDFDLSDAPPEVQQILRAIFGIPGEPLTHQEQFEHNTNVRNTLLEDLGREGFQLDNLLLRSIGLEQIASRLALGDDQSERAQAIREHNDSINMSLKGLRDVARAVGRIAQQSLDLSIETDRSASAGLEGLEAIVSLQADQIGKLERVVGLLCVRTGIMADTASEFAAAGDTDRAQAVRELLDRLTNTDSAAGRLSTPRSAAADTTVDL